jgi:uncharacterized tellurite resistance protein B-like protein
MKITKIRNLVALAYSDGYFDTKELEYINKRAREEGLKNEELINILQNPYKSDYEIPITTKEKFEFLFDMMTLIHADNVVSEDEKIIFYKHLKYLGFKEDYQDELFEICSNSIQKNSTFDEFYNSIN